MPTQNPNNKKPLWVLIAGFSSVLVANGFLVYFALSTWTGLETEQHYVKGLSYNTNLEAARRQQEMGWVSRSDTNFTDDKSGIFRVRFADKNAAPLDNLDIRIQVTRPTHSGYDSQFALIPTSSGAYAGKFKLPLKGQWDFRIVARRGDEAYQRVERIVTP